MAAIFDITFFSAVRTVRAAVPHMLGRSGGAIVNISSLTAKLPDGMIAPYSAAKAALTKVNKALAEDLTPQGIRVNAISHRYTHHLPLSVIGTSVRIQQRIDDRRSVP